MFRVFGSAPREKTMVVAMGEFGRTPRMKSATGRDHWGHTFSVMMAGG